MSKRMAVVPPEFLIGHHQQKSELRSEEELANLLDREQLADDLKVKLLSQLLTRYQKTAHEPSEPIRVSIVDENEQAKIVENVKADTEIDPILKDIMISSPHSFVKFIPSIVEKLMSRENEFEIHLEQSSKAATFLYILNLADVDTVINTSKTFKFRPSQQFPLDLSYSIIIKNPSNVVEHTIPVVRHLNDRVIAKTSRELFSVFKENIKLLNLDHLIQFIYNDTTSEVDIHLAKNIEIHFTRTLGESLLEKLNFVKDTIVKGVTRFQVNRAHPVDKEDHFKIIVKEYFKRVEVFEQTYELFLNVGMYKTEELFNAFQFLTLTQLPNSHVAIEVPQHIELHLGRGLADLLGFTGKEMSIGSYVGKYPIQLNAGISEIFVYSDVVESHHVGDSFSPLLRKIPCLNEKNEQIVKYYENPLYFPLKKTFVETIEIDLRVSSGDNIIFTGGRTYVVLSFRRKPIY
ncbi:uncharacterized protein NPIL_308741 [Nephila pilipes]|uniref:Uncharacterized protein n=1 Tax=Nephila pilipes TaxID=299642 RepID=A0A8X6MX99_NEPPI|nr:uncharacterized protein NPIL_308741 [Nephila pilipes]